MADYSVEIIGNQRKLVDLSEQLVGVSVFALDIETAEWWNRQRERVALIQLAFRTARGGVKVAVIDALAALDLKVLSASFESNSVTKIIHNAAFDAARLNQHYKFKIAPVYDTMLAARRNGEKKYSLQAQSAAHLNLHLDKGAQRSDWSRRPLDLKQINYAALDAYAALRLYEHQARHNLNGIYRPKESSSSLQRQLPLGGAAEASDPIAKPIVLSKERKDELQEINLPAQYLPAPLVALLGIISELPSRYSPNQLAVSVGQDRIGLAGWIVDRTLGKDADFDEDNARLAIADLFERQLITLTETRRLEATEDGTQTWRKLKPEQSKI